MSRDRLALGGLLAATVAAGLALRAFVDGAVAKYGGVALWAMAVYLVVLIVAPRLTVARASVIALAISWTIELAQLSPLPAWLSSQHLVLRLVFGTTFHPPDLPAYLIGVALAAALHGRLRRGAR